MSKLIELGLSENHLPVLPLVTGFVLPKSTLTIYVGRTHSINSLKFAVENDLNILIANQKEDFNGIKLSNYKTVGVLAKITSLDKLEDGKYKLSVENLSRCSGVNYTEVENTVFAEVINLVTVDNTSVIERLSWKKDIINLASNLIQEVQDYAHISINSYINIESFEELVDSVAYSFVSNKPEKGNIKEKILTEPRLKQRALSLIQGLSQELDILKISKKIQSKVKEKVEKNSRDFFLVEQQKAILEELGEDTDSLESLEKKIKNSKMTKEAEVKCLNELKKIKSSPNSQESNVSRSYIDVLLSLPWDKRTSVNYDISKAKEVLDLDHYGMEEAKTRILEFISVKNRLNGTNSSSPVLNFHGVPGVGKSTLAESLAKSMGLEFVRIPLGGLHDESELRGHRKTYLGAMPGKIINAIIKSGVKNPVILLDEIDKISSNGKGDPAAAFLEILDPNQNKNFYDNYVEVGFDLSEVLFICTSNNLSTISEPLYDRMETITLSGYTELEKFNISKNYLIPRNLKETGLNEGEIIIDDDALTSIINDYTFESGVRSLSRQINKLSRKVVYEIDTLKFDDKIKISKGSLEKYLGSKKTFLGKKRDSDSIGVFTGLAYTSNGGDTLDVECVTYEGTGKVKITGSAGDVMKESVELALSLVKKRYESLGINYSDFTTKDLHLSVGDLSTPKEGPSATLVITAVIASALSNRPLRSDLAATGECFLSGKSGPIGGLREKSLAALRAGFKSILIPQENIRDLMDLPKEVKESLEIIPITNIDQFLDQVFVK